MKNLKNPFYKDTVTNLEEYLNRCKELDDNFTFSSENQNLNDQESSVIEEENDCISDDKLDSKNKGEKENIDEEQENIYENNFIENDAIRKHQFNYNVNTYFGHNFPEIRAGNNIVAEKEPLVIAPGEGKIPTDFPEHWEAKSFPTHFPDGKNDKDESRPVRLSDSQYISQRLM